MDFAHKNSVEVIGDVELFCRERRANAKASPFAAITGTNGKSTTTALLAHVMQYSGFDTQVGGNLGSSAAQSVILMVIVIALTAVQFRYVERKVTY